MKPTCISADKFFADTWNFLVTKAFENSDLLCSQWMLPHKSVHCRSKQEGTCEIPCSYNTALSIMDITQS